MSEIVDATKETEQIVISEAGSEIKKSEAPTESELKEKGWTDVEIKQAEKHGMIKKQGVDEQKAAPEKVAELSDKEVKQTESVSPVVPADGFKNPEDEKKFLEAYPKGTPARGAYIGMKVERQKRQVIERELKNSQQRFEELRKEIEELKKNVVKVEVDENGNQIDPDDKPLTRRELAEIEKKRSEANEMNNRMILEERNAVSDSLRNQEDYAREIYPDYDSTLELAKEVMQNLDEVLPNKWEREKALGLIENLQVRAANAHKYGVDDFNAALISYEIGRLNPKYGQSTNGHKKSDVAGNLDPNKANGGQMPEKMKRIETNTQRRTSSASISGGGSQRSIVASEMTINDFVKLNAEQRLRFREKYPEKYAEIARG